MISVGQDVNYSLICAVREGKLKRARQLINSFGLSYSPAWSEGYVLLCDAIKNKHAAVAKLLLNCGSKVNSKNCNPSNSPLHFAATNGNIEVVKMLLDKGAKIDAKNRDGRTPLHNAIKFKRMEVTELLLKHGADVSARDNDGARPIHVAAEIGCLQIIECLLDYGAYVNCVPISTLKKGYAPLHLAVEKGSKEVITFLLSRGANVDVKGKDGITPLHIAAKKGYTHIAEDLLNHGACIHSLTLKDGYMPLHFASELGNGAAVKLFLDRGADVNASTKGNDTPLHIATKRGHSVIKLLLQYGAKVDNQDKDGRTILHLAVEKGYLRIVEDVLKYCPDINNQSNKSSLKIAVCGCGKEYEKIVEALLECGFNVSPEDANYPELLHAAVEKGYLKILEDLLKYGANVNALHNSILKLGLTPLHTAVKNKNEEVAKLLINYEADINAQDQTGKAPIFYAIENASLKVTKLLLTSGANIKDCPELLNIAAKKGCIGIVEALLQHDADINAQDRTGKPPIFYAIKSANSKITKMLLASGANVKDRPELLNIAAKKECIEIVEALLQHDADINAQDKTGKPPIFYAIENANSKITKMLLASGANVKDSPELLNIAAKKECIEIVEALLQHDADINAQDETGKPPIFYAIENANSKITKMLLASGANVKDSPELLNIAVRHKCIEIVEALLQHDADINAQDKTGKPPIFYAIENANSKITKILLASGANVKDSPELLNIAAKKECIEIVEDLLQHHADINAQDKTGKPPIFYAIENANSKITKMLLTSGANIKDSPELLNIAAKKGCIEIVEALLQHDADINGSDKYGRTALHFTAEGISTEGTIKREIAKLLLDKGANVNAKQQNGLTALHIATENGHKELVEVLLECGAEVDSRDDYGMTALHMASQERHENVVVTLLEHDSDINITCRDNCTPLDYCRLHCQCDYDSEDDWRDNHDHGVCSCEVTALECHIVKMKTANLYVSEQNLQLINSLNNYEMRCFQDECEEEIASMKCEKINNHYISFYDILAKDTSSLAIYMRNENIVNVLKSDNYKTKFPIYASMIESNFRKGMERNELLEQGNEIFHILFNNFPELPYDCTEKILSYLSGKDLRMLIDACKPLNISNSQTKINEMITSNIGI